MKKTLLSMVAALAVVFSASAVSAQLPGAFAVELRAGLAFPSGDLSEPIEGAETESGVTYGVNAQFRATPSIGVYAGYNRSDFGFDGVDDVEIHTEGFNGGVLLRVPVTGFSPYLKGGVVYQHVGFSAEGEEDDDSDDELGFEVGAGLDFALGNRLSVTPEVSYSSVSLGDEIDVTVSQIKVDVGLKIRI